MNFIEEKSSKTSSLFSCLRAFVPSCQIFESRREGQEVIYSQLEPHSNSGAAPTIRKNSTPFFSSYLCRGFTRRHEGTKARRIFLSCSQVALRLSVSLLLIFFLGRSALAGEKIDFTGAWDSKETENSSFYLELVQKGSHIAGYHICIVLHSHRTDAVLPTEGEPSIQGNVSGNMAHVKFRSGYSDATGEATILIQGDTIFWKITKSSPGHYFPKNEVLYRRKPNK